VWRTFVAHLMFDDVDALYRDVVARDAIVQAAPTDKPWGLREFALATPDGHRITCGQPIPKMNPLLARQLWGGERLAALRV
jgi:uncharacterized glyoxalase superfamily protein PhnB